MKFEILWNTGDIHWDNDPDEETFEGDYNDIQEYMNLTDEQLDDLKVDGYVYDTDEEIYCVKFISEN